MTAPRPEVYFYDPRFRMTFVGRATVQLVSRMSYFLIAIAMPVALLSESHALRGAGILLGIFLLDRLLHLREAPRALRIFPVSGRVNLAPYLAPAAFSYVERAFQDALLGKKNFFLEILSRLVRHPEIKEGLFRLDVNPEEFEEKVRDASAASPETSSTKDALMRAVEDFTSAALEHGISNRARFIGIPELFEALRSLSDPALQKIFSTFSIDAGDLDRALIFGLARRRFSGLRRLPASLGGFIFEAHRGRRHRVMNRAWTARPTPTLDRLSHDLTDFAAREEIGFLVGHEEEYRQLVEAISRPTNPNALLVGEAGAGKETIVAHLAFQIARDGVPAAIFDKRLVSLQLGQLVSGAPPEELQKRLHAIVEEITLAGNVILFIPDIHNLVKTSGTAYLSAADALLPIITNNAFPVVGATYPREFKEFLESRSDFVGAFEVIRVSEISEAEAEKLLVYQSLIWERLYRILVSFGAVKAAVRIAKKYFHEKPLPSSADALLKSAVVAAHERGVRAVGANEVIVAAEEKIKVPIGGAEEGEAEALLRLEETIHKRLVDQEEAVTAVADALRAYRSGLSRTGGPIAGFLFVGPTGVGKTELSKILSAVQFGSKDAMIRFDMTEYQDKQSFYRFIGSPDGKTSGVLTDAVRERPYSLILLDEFEKAHPDILGLFLQVLDDGRLTDNLGRLVDFQNTIVIATSNAHSDIINASLREGQTMSQIADYLKHKLTDVFKPELLNRFSKIIVFKDLSPEDVRKIAALHLKDLGETLASQGITFAFDGVAEKLIAKWGYDPAFGARPLRRVIEEKVRAPLAEKILKKELRKGGEVRMVGKGEALAFEVG